jgi:hypothetical protein
LASPVIEELSHKHRELVVFFLSPLEGRGKARSAKVRGNRQQIRALKVPK